MKQHKQYLIKYVKNSSLLNNGLYPILQHTIRSVRIIKRIIICLLLVLPMFFVQQASADEPAWNLVTAPPVSPEAARQTQTLPLGMALMMLPGPTTSETQITPEIEELARALNHDPKLIFDYVRNHIDYVPIFGSVNGATATLLAGRGNDFDQASLLIALLRESGYTADYVCGDVTYALADAAQWLGVDVNADVISSLLANGGIPVTEYLDAVKMTRVWVKATIDSTDYIFDPAFKVYDYIAGIDVPQAMGYNQSGFLSSAGGTFGADYVQYMSNSNVRSALQTYSTSLINYIKANKPNATIEEIIGGRKIHYEELSSYPTNLPSAVSIANTEIWSEIPANYRLTIRIQHEGIDHTFKSWEIAGKRVTIFYTGTGYAPVLRVDGEIIATGTATTYGSIYNLNVTVDHPYAGNNGTYADQSDTFNLKSGSVYNISCSFEGVSSELIKARNSILTENRYAGEPDQSDAVLGETLHIMGLTWLNECRYTQDMGAQLADVAYVRHHQVGIMAQETGYYIDVKIAAVSVISIHGYQDDDMGWFRALSGLASGFEHGMLEQLQGSDKPGTSTIKLLQISNNNGKKTFYADNTSFDWNQLQNYSPSKITELQNGVAAGYKYILPEDADINLEQWTGVGYIRAGASSVGMIISGDYNGGYSATSESVYVPEVHRQTTVSVPNISTQANIYTPKSIEPVDLASGAYLHDNTDLSLDSTGLHGIHFTRSYNSSNNYVEHPLGFGWTHSYDIYIEEHSHGDPVLDGRQPVDAASAIAGLYVIWDVLKDHNDLQGWMATSLANKWIVDQVIDNAVTLHMGNKTIAYVKLPTGSYSPPPGITAELIENGSTFELHERFDTVLEFNSENRISTWTDADDKTLTFSYSGDKLSTVHDAFGRTVTLSYSGDRLSSVSDSASRSVSFGYENDNLTTYTDTAGKVWHYGYDDRHRMTTLTNPLSITTATNAYDELGRVKTQTVPRKIGETTTTATYNFYISGFRNAEEDPYGNQTVYFLDDNGRTVGVQNALGNRNTKEYDGQNHVTKSVDPRDNAATFEYDGNHNLKKITDQLGKSTNHYYDAQFRKTDSTDPLGHTIHLDYNTEHHVTQTTTYPEQGQQICTSATYYTNGLPSTTTDGRGTVTTMIFDTYGNPDKVQTGSYPAVDYNYDTIGRMLSLTDQAESTTTFVYDDRGLIQSKTDPLGKTTSFTYNDDGSLHTVTDRKNRTTTYAYTPTGKVDSVTYHDATTVGFVYDLHENLKEMHDTLGTTTYDYDAANRLTSSTDPHGLAVSYAYDEAGNLTELTYPGNKKVIYTYDALNRLSTVTIDWISSMTATYYYDDAGRLTGIDNFNGTWSSYGYDNADRETDIQNRKTDYSTIATYHYTLDGNGNRTFIDQAEPLTPSLSSAIVNYTYNDKKNRLVSAGSSVYTHDDEGQLLTKDGTAYTFDDAHRLTAIGTEFQFSYDGGGNRLQAVRNSVTTRYIYDAAGNLLAEADINNTITRYYIYGKGLLAIVTPADDIYCYHFNAIGSTIAVTDENQDIVNSYAYTPFGIIASEQETVSQPFKYVGQLGVMTEPNGLYYMRARYYDPETSRFISEDPIGFDGGDVNLYIYVGNNPVLLVDPSGLINWWQLAIGVKHTAMGIGLISTGIAIPFVVGPITGGAGVGIVIPMATVPFVTGGSGLFYLGAKDIVESFLEHKVEAENKKSAEINYEVKNKSNYK